MNKHYAFTDLHGNYNLWNSIKNYCDETDVMIYLGDACDRGVDGIKIMQELIADPRVIYLMGNHELMFLKGVRDYNSHDFKLWIRNGGSPTFEQFLSLSKEEQEALLNSMKNLGICCSYKNRFLSHSGCFFKDLLTKKVRDIDLLWNRKHLEADCVEDALICDKIIIHGHTPVQILNRNNKEIYKYCNNQKIDIDMGTFFSKTIALLDLDTLIPMYFKE